VLLTRDLAGGRRTLLLGSAGLLCLLLVAAVAWDTLYKPTPVETRAESRRERTRVAVPRPPEPAPDPSTYTNRQVEQAAVLVGSARRLALEGKVADAEAALAEADRIAPTLPETSEARREIARLATAKGRLEHFVLEARRAVERDDAEAAHAAIAAADAVDANAPELATLRQQLAAREAELAKQREQIAMLLKRMREALARRDFAGAYRAVNEAERIDVNDPRIDEARAELDKAEAQAR
jgi:hypothetical protein